MNKKLLALAVAGAFAAPVAAMADSGNVTVYGVVNASVDRTDNGDSTAGAQGTTTTKVSSNSSRIGFKGTEDLGNGLSAVWQIESAVNVDDNTNGTLASRNSFVGLSGKSWGTALLGRHDTPYKMVTRSLDVFGDSIADNRSIMGSVDTLSHDTRANNVIAYISPNFSGFTAAGAYVAGAETATTSSQKKGNAWSLMANYDNGPLYVGAGWQRFKFGDATAAGSATCSAPLPCTVVSGAAATTTGSLGSADVADKTAKAWKIGAAYTFGAFKVGGVFEKFSDDFTDHADRKSWTLNGAYTFGSNAVKLAYVTAGDIGTNSDTGVKQWAIGFDHSFSKRTTAYALYTKLDNDKNINYGLGTGATTGAVSALGNGADPSAWSFGVKHSF